MEHMSFSRLFMAVSLILIYVIQKLFGLTHHASPPMNLKPFHDDLGMAHHLTLQDQLQFIDSDYYKTTSKLLDDIQLDSVSLSYLSMSVLLFELKERQGCLGANNYSVIRTFSAVNAGKVVLRIRGFKIGSTISASDILHDKLHSIAKFKRPKSSVQSNVEFSSSSSPTTPSNDHRYRHKIPQSQQSVCHGYGFTIFDCEPFDLEPNREHKIRIGFNPDFTLTKSIVSLTIFTNRDEEFNFALVATIPRDLLKTCNQSMPRPEWEPTMHFILAAGMLILMLISTLTAYMEAMLYLKSQRAMTAQNCNGQTLVHGNQHGGSSKDYERTNCSSNSSDSCNKDHSTGGGHGTVAAISSHMSNQQRSTSTSSSNSPTLTALANTSGKGNFVNKSNGVKSANSCTQKRRKNSASTNSEKVPTNKSLSSTSNDKKLSNHYAPTFQNLTNVIASPPPPLPTFENEFDSLEFKKLRGRRGAKKSNSLNGGIASSTRIAAPVFKRYSREFDEKKCDELLTQYVQDLKPAQGGDSDVQEIPQQDLPLLRIRLEYATKSELFDEADINAQFYTNHAAKKQTITPIQPPSSLSSTPSSSTPSTSGSTSSSTSSSPPLSASSYGEYSLLGPGASFELPCLRVRSAQT